LEYIFPRFGTLHQEKSGNPGAKTLVSSWEKKSFQIFGAEKISLQNLLIRPNLLNRISSGHFHCSQISHDL
jgi:hypothetical protein